MGLCQIPESLSLLDLVDLFKETKTHLVFVSAEQDSADFDPPQKPAYQGGSPHIGLVTLNDVYTRMLKRQPDDEHLEEARETHLASEDFLVPLSTGCMGDRACAPTELL